METLTKKARIERAREVIDRNHVGVPFSEGDVAEFSAITGCALRYVCRAHDPNYPSNPRHTLVLAYDWEEPRGWSWRRAIQFGQHQDDQHRQAQLTQAFRDAVKYQVDEFMANADLVCSECYATDHLTVDHVSPPFSKIMHGYVSEYGEPEIVQRNGSGFVFSSLLDEDVWRNYHLERAALGILCRSCNSRKGARQ